ncbi:MAG: hypothetical protein CEE40_00440 [Chloroflexi bacterium B3_Chlor]|nr:MAG: hypothetical protein CEE40_00440 [Chloroflexi bacterium B3_Chlor]
MHQEAFSNPLTARIWLTKLGSIQQLPPQEGKESQIKCLDVAERRIQEAQEHGLFDDLPGKGKPLHLSEYPFVKPGWRLAHGILKNAGFTLYWIELDRTIRTELAQCLELLEDQLAWANEVLSSRKPGHWIEVELDDVYRWTKARFSERAERLNKKIELFNLIVPLINLQQHKIQIAEELSRFQASWPQRGKVPK